MWRYVLAWFPMVVLGILNGVFREAIMVEPLGELTAHQLSTVTAIALFGGYIWAVSGLWRLESSGQAVAIGLVWLVMTVGFEFLFGHHVIGHPWSRLAHDYDLLAGRLWLLVLVWLAASPWVFFRLRSRRGSETPG